MAGTTRCPSCGRQNRVPAVAAGKPTCGVCGASLPWIVEATDDNFDGALDTTVPVLVDMWAPWCAPCRTVAPILDQLARERAGRLKVVKVSVDESPRVSARYRVQGIPTLLLFRSGELAGRQVGALPAAALSQWLDAHASDAA